MSLVEYHDPDGLFPAVSPLLAEHLPLRNLHWKSPTRPIRSIASLQVDFLPAHESHESIESPLSALSAASAVSGVSGVSTRERNTPVGETPQSSVENFTKSLSHAEKARRHQVPGLRQTPFVKIFILRCDDIETYRDTSRRQIREWVNKNASATHSSSNVNRQANHDASEWLILHVVLPDTTAAAQPRWSKKSSAGEDSVVKEKSSKTGSILEKLRADFNVPGKSLIHDRIAQIRLPKDAVPAYMLPALPSVGLQAVVETPREWETSWNDLVSKLKNFILSSFDTRVSQYEDDVQEKDAQRNLPGWNFCTFFVLKEGLILAFESVGLLEDALAGYDELSMGLETILYGQVHATSSTSATSFLPCSPDLRAYLRRFSNSSLKATDEEAASLGPYFKTPLTLRKNYRQLIVSNNISVFDLKCYIFSRQMNILLRLAKIQNRSLATPKVEAKQSAGGARKQALPASNGTIHDISALGELYERAKSFLVSTAKLMRKDLESCPEAKSEDNNAYSGLIDTMIHTWSFAVAGQVLEETYSSELDSRLKDAAAILQASANKQDQISARRVVSPLFSQSKASISALSLDDSSLSATDRSPQIAQQGKPSELAFVAANRGEFCVIQRNSLSLLAWGQKDHLQKKNAVSADNDTRGSSRIDQQLVSKLLSTNKDHFNVHLHRVLSSKDESMSLYEDLTTRAIRLYDFSNRRHTVQHLMADMAAIRLENGDYVEAANLFNKLISAPTDQPWTSISSSLLLKYSECLKLLHRRDEYIRILLAILSRSAKDQKALLKRNAHGKVDESRLKSGIGTSETRSVLKALATASEELTYDVTASLTDYFEEPRMDRHITLCESEHGFQLGIDVRQYIGQPFELESVRARLVNITDDQGKEFWAASTKRILLDKPLTRLMLYSNVTTNAQFIVDRIELKFAKIVFVYETLSKNSPSTPLTFLGSKNFEHIHSVKGSTIRCYPHADAFEATIQASASHGDDKRKALKLSLNSGSLLVDKVDITVKAASAGLRIRTAEAVVTKGNVNLRKSDKPGEILLGQIESGAETVLQIPFDLEQNLREINARLEVRYRSDDKEYIYLSSPNIRLEPLIDAEVQKLFAEDVLLCRYKFQSLTDIPSIIQNAQLGGFNDDNTEVLSGKPWTPVLATAAEPPSAAYLIKSRRAFEKKPKLTVTFRSMERVAASQALNAFSRSLRASEFEQLRGAVVPFLKDRLAETLTKEHYETLGLLGECDMPSYSDIRWENLADWLPRGSRYDSLQGWLQDWHKTHDTLRVPIEDAGSPKTVTGTEATDCYEQLTRELDIDSIDFLHTAALELAGRNKRRVAAVGERLEAELSIRHTRKWSARAESSTEPPPIMDFDYEIMSQHETWVVGGQRMGSFSAREGERITIKLGLVPLRPGTLLLPAVEVKLAGMREVAGSTGAPVVGDYTCQTDCTSRCHTVAVVENMRSTTVALGQEASILQGMAFIESAAR